MRRHLEDDLTDLRNSIFSMGILVEETLHKAYRALKEQNTDLAQEVFKDEEEINRLQHTLEHRCAEILATEHPVAGDLREILTSFKIIADIERIGDHAVHFAKALMRLRKRDVLRDLSQFFSMAEEGISMFHDALTAYIEHDAEKAREVASRDSRIDEMHGQILQHLFRLIKEHPDRPEDFTSLLFLNRFLERLGDHVTNICEWVVFSTTGVHEELNQ